MLSDPRRQIDASRVRLNDHAGEAESDTRSFRLGREQGNEQRVRLRQTDAVVLDEHAGTPPVPIPAKTHAPTDRQHRLGRVAEQVDEGLCKLVLVGVDDERSAILHVDGHTALQHRQFHEQQIEPEWRRARRGQASQGSVAGDEPGERLGAALDDVETDTQLVERFSRLMGQRDWAVEPPRMLRDSAYAYKRLAIAFSSGDAALKALSIDLYQHYQAQAHGRRHAAGN